MNISMTCETCGWTASAPLGAGVVAALREHTRVVHPPVYGMCTACGAVETRLVKQTGTRDLSAIGEHRAYPTGYGCEMCS